MWPKPEILERLRNSGATNARDELRSRAFVLLLPQVLSKKKKDPANVGAFATGKSKGEREGEQLAFHHTTLKIRHPVRSGKSSSVGPG